LVYFAVADCDQSTEQAKKLGAKILVPPMEAGDVGRFSVIQDPQGAVLSIIKLNNPGQ
jgi:predicted enzyme related to lactoylglutathione lyase